MALIHGDSASRGWAREVLDTLEISEIGNTLATVSDVDARSWRFQEELYRALDRRDDLTGFAVVGNTWVSLQHGALSEYLARLFDPRVPATWRQCTLGFVYANGLPVSEERLESEINMAAVDTTDAWAMICAAQYSAHRERWDDHSRLVDRLDALAARTLANADTSAAEFGRDLAQLARGYGQAKRGQPDGLTLMDKARRERNFFVDVIGDLHVEMGNYQDAVRYYRADWTSPIVRLKLAHAYEMLGEEEKAAQAYRYFVEAWADADPELQPMVEEAKRAIVRLRADF